MSFSPSGRFLSFLDDEAGGLERSLYVLDLEDGSYRPRRIDSPSGPDPDELPIEEQLRRERARELGRGVTSATWAESADVLLVPLPDGAHVLVGLPTDPRLVPVARGGLPADVLSARLSPDGTKLACVSGGELFVVAAAEDAVARRLTEGAEDGLTHGLAEFLAQEEMGREEGFWWSPDSASLAYAEVDEREVPLYRIVHQASEVPYEEECHRYPFAGGPNASYRLGVVAASGGGTTWMDLAEGDTYLARVHWSRPLGLVAEIETRDQRQLEVVALDPSSGSARLLHRETGDPWVNLHDDFRSLGSGEWLWSSERSGFRHIEVRSSSGELDRELTSGEWQVDSIEAVDEEAGVVYFTGTRDGPTERHLYCVPLHGGECSRLTAEPGTHHVAVADRSGHFADRHSALDSPPQVSLRALPEGERLTVLNERADPRVAELGLEPPVPFAIEADDGTKLHGLFFRPVGKGPFPLAVSVYGGPHAQLVTDDWSATADLRAQALVRSGVAVMRLDNRGSARRGLAFESVLHHNLGDLEVADQLAGVRWAIREGPVDPARVAVYGWSYGGYMTLRCLELAGDTFRAGAAGAPVTDWDGYDSHYTERYMGTPEDSADAYAKSSALALADALSGELLVVHGLLDENVHFRHSARLINRLVSAGVSHRLLCFPEERHMPRREEDRAYLENEVLTFLRQALRPVHEEQVSPATSDTAL